MQIIKFESIPSTNSTLLEFSKKNAKAWTVIWTSNQTKGRGYAGNEWLSQLDKNLAFSVLIKNELKYEELIYFNQWVCNQIKSYLSRYSPDVYVKWPNDVIIANKKVCGVLVETYRSKNELNILIGIGLNINQENFKNLPKAGSLLTQTNKQYKIEEILSGLLTKLKDNYFEVEQKLFQKISDEYNSYLYCKDKISVFEKNGKKFNGIIKSVDKNGKLIVQTEEQTLQSFMHKEVILHF